MREIKFRAKCFDGYWVYGDLHLLCSQPHIHTAESPYPFAGKRKFIDPDTIGQFTGLYDHDGNEIYEGDIVSYLITTGGIKSERISANVAHVVRYDLKYAIFRIGYHAACYGTMMEAVHDNNLIVIGNIYDNHELIKDK